MSKFSERLGVAGEADDPKRYVSFLEAFSFSSDDWAKILSGEGLRGDVRNGSGEIIGSVQIGGSRD